MDQNRVDSPKWGRLPLSIMEDKTLSLAERGLYALIITHCGWNDYFKCTMKHLAKLAGVSIATIYRIVDKLIDSGYISFQKNNAIDGEHLFIILKPVPKGD